MTSAPADHEKEPEHHPRLKDKGYPGSTQVHTSEKRQT
jgi:hypothetical protein